MALSRIVLTLSLSFAALPFAVEAETPVYEMIAQTNEWVVVDDTECESNGRQIVVCAPVNENDRYRLPFETAVAGDPANEGVWEERERIQAEPGRCQGWENVQVGCGAVGVSFGVGGANPGLRTGGLRRVGR
ncbi:MAG: hypothetical protein HKN78_10750 [Sphingomonadaceae bacterium]|nr:hypothetical protein [Sphingomonadaceae bacterium]